MRYRLFLACAFALCGSAALAASHTVIEQGPLLCQAPDGVEAEFSFLNCERRWENYQITLKCPLSVTEHGIKKKYVADGSAEVTKEHPPQGHETISASYVGLQCWVHVPQWARDYRIDLGSMKVRGAVCIEKLGACFTFTGKLSEAP